MIKLPKYLSLLALLTAVAGTTSADITPALAQAQVIEFMQVIGIGQNDSTGGSVLMANGPSFEDPSAKVGCATATWSRLCREIRQLPLN